ncbi:MAG: tetratricopeptide repeat protein [Thermodesulfobacteriota bacterium]
MQKTVAWLFLSAVLLITGIVYVSHVSPDFVGIDLLAYQAVLYSNEFAETVWRLFTDMRGALVPGYYAPLGSVSLLFDKVLIGSELPDGRVTAFVNLLCHCLNGVLLYLLLSRLGFSVITAFVAASIFLLHPIQVPVIMWFAERKTVMAACFCFLSYLCYLKYLQGGEIRTHDCKLEGERVSFAHVSYHWYGLALVAFAAGLLSKPTAVVLPAIMLVGEWLGLHRVVPRSETGSYEPRSVRYWIDRAGLLRIGPFALLAAVMCLVTIRTEGAHVMDLPIIQRPFIASAALWFYVYKILLPMNLLAIYPKWNVNPGDYVWWIPFLLSALAAWLLIRYRLRISRGFWWALAFFVIPLLPVVGVVPFGYFQLAYVGNHLAYLSMAGAAAALALLVEVLGAAIATRNVRLRTLDLTQSAGQAKMPPDPIGAKMGLTPGAGHSPSPCPLPPGERVSRPPSLDGREKGEGDEHLLSQRPIPYLNACAPNLPLPKGEKGGLDSVGILGAERKPAGRLAGNVVVAAVVSYLALLCTISWNQAALWSNSVTLWSHNKEQCDTCWHARYALAVVFLSSGLPKQAALEYEGILAGAPTHASALNDLAVLRQNQNRNEDAIRLFERAIKHKPDYVLAHTNLASALVREGRFKEAEELLRQSIQRWPDHARPYMALGLLRMDQGRYAEADVLLAKAIQLDPVLVTAYPPLADARLRQGAIENAHEVAIRALRLKADSVEVLNILGAIEGDRGRPEKALEWLRRATRHHPTSAEPHHNMGVALMDLGRFGEARESFEAAIRLRPEFAEAHEHLGLAQMNLGNARAAIEHLRKALEINPSLTTAREALDRAVQASRARNSSTP